MTRDLDLSDKGFTPQMTLNDHFARVFKEAGLVVLIGLSVFLLLAVWSYDPRDPGWSHAGYQPDVRNLVGVTGAWIADLAISFFGITAYLLPPMLMLPTLRFLMRRRVGMLDAIPYLMLRVTGAVMFVLGLCTLASIHISNETLGYPFTAGGLSGQAISDLSVVWLSVLGSSVIFWTLMLFGLTLYMELSWQRVLEAIGGALLSIFAGSGKLLPSTRDNAPSTEKTAKKVDPLMDDTPGEGLKERFSEKLSSRLSGNISDKLSGIRLSRRDPEDDEDLEISMPVEPRQVAKGPVARPVAQKKASAGERQEPMLSALSLDDQLDDEPSFGQPVINRASFSGEPSATAAPSAQSSDPAARKSLKIVPLSEAHQPMQETDLELGTPTKETMRKPAKRQIPSLDLLDPPELKHDQGYTEEQLESMSRLLETKLSEFGVVAEVVEVNPGPVITRFELQPAPGVKASKISNLSQDLARSMLVRSVRVVEVIPGKSVVGIEIPNESREVVHLSEVLNSKPFLEAPSRLTLALGNDIAGNPVVANLAKMPHLLVAGTTGSGKSVGINAMLLSLLFKATPDEVRLLLIDPKMLELAIYEGIPHLLTPVITDMKEAAAGLRWCVNEMERRYRLMAKMGVRNIAGFNEKLVQAEAQGTPLRDPLWRAEDYGLPAGEPAPLLESLPYIVVVIDEFADMMMVVGKKVEELIARIAQKARAAGIHLILATQRPSVDVITGLIKANVPTRIAFQVSTKIDSRTILDQSGAENLLGNGDMLYLPAGTSIPNRVHGAFVSDDEVHRSVEAWKQLGAPNYIDNLLSDGSDEMASGGGGGGLFDDEQDPLYDEAVAFVTETRKASISAVQRKLKIGYNRAARMIETMEASGVVTPAGSNGQREVMAPAPPRD